MHHANTIAFAIHLHRGDRRIAEGSHQPLDAAGAHDHRLAQVFGARPPRLARFGRWGVPRRQRESSTADGAETQAPTREHRGLPVAGLLGVKSMGTKLFQHSKCPHQCAAPGETRCETVKGSSCLCAVGFHTAFEVFKDVMYNSSQASRHPRLGARQTESKRPGRTPPVTSALVR